MRTASVVSAGRFCSCWGAVSSLSAGFFVGGTSDGPPSRLHFLLEVGTVRPVEVLASSGSDPSSDTVTTLSSSLSEEMPNRPVDSLLGVPYGPAAFLFWKGNCTSIFCRGGWISASPSSSGNGDCGLSVSSGC